MWMGEYDGSYESLSRQGERKISKSFDTKINVEKVRDLLD